MNLTLEQINEIYKEVRKNTKNKRKIYYFEINKMQNFKEIKEMLNDYDGGIYNIFVITKPKIRIVMSQNIKDKIINHAFTRYVLKNKLEKYLDYRNIATRENKGTDYGIKLLKKYLEKNKKYDKFYILKIDISKYFYNIDHQILKEMLKNKLKEQEYELLEKILNSTNKEYINEKITKLNEKYKDLPIYKNNKGLPIGNMTSQFLSIFYLNEIDHMIIHSLKIKYFIRYMDDFILIYHNKTYLKECLKRIEKEINKYKLQINKNKTEIKCSLEWNEFLGYRFKIQNKKAIFILKKESIKRIKKRVKELKYLYKNNKISEKTIFSSIMTFTNSFKYGSYTRRKRIIDLFYEK